jgi:SAM-dependent methyltransferase
VNIKILANSRNFYWGIIPELELAALNKSISKVGIKKAIKLHKFSQRFDYATDPNRANALKFLFPNKLPYRVLEIGCGYGNLTIQLAKTFDHIDAIDAVYQSLLFTKHRITDAKISNVKLFQTDSFETSDFLDSFKNNSYDLLVVNGVLEWVGSGGKKGSPNKYQSKFLQTCLQKLKDDGLLFLAIENRNYPGWIKRDPHSKLPLTSIAPRKIASLISLVASQKKYKTYIYSYRSLIKLMKKNGFFLNSKFYVFHSYRSPKIMFQNNEIFARELLEVLPEYSLTRKWRMFIRYGFRFSLIDKFIPTFIHIYQKSDRRQLVYKYKFAFVKGGKLVRKNGYK